MVFLCYNRRRGRYMRNKISREQLFFMHLVDKYDEEFLKIRDKSNIQDPKLRKIYNYFKNRLHSNFSIGMMWYEYVKVKNGDSAEKEFEKIEKHMDRYLKKYAKENKLDLNKIDTDIINYGSTEFVFALIVDKKVKCSLLLKQPIVPFGNVYKEMQNLLELSKTNNNVITPIDYYAKDEQELMVTPYIKQARCISCGDDVWGMYIPEPCYRFEAFSKEQESLVLECMIAKLMSMYDFDKKRGLSKFRFRSGDFMFTKSWSECPPTVATTLHCMWLGAARDFVECSFEDYKSLMIKELSKSGKENSKNIIFQGPYPAVDEKVVENGMKLGEKLIKDKIKLKSEKEFEKR